MTISEIVNKIYESWAAAVSTKVGDNHSMENSTIVNVLPYATLYFMGLPTAISTLEGDEGGVSPSIQVDIYTNGQQALTDAYEIDDLSHSVLVGKYHFRRNYGPELIQSTDPSIKRLTSRYTRIIGYAETLE